MKIIACLTLGILAAAATPARPAENTASLMIDVLEASEQPGPIDPGLAYIREQLERSPFRYQRYRNLASSSRVIALGRTETVTFVLPQQLTVELTPKRLTESTIDLKLRLWQEKRLVLDTDLSLARRGTLIVGGPATPRSALMIALSEGL